MTRSVSTACLVAVCLGAILATWIPENIDPVIQLGVMVGVLAVGVNAVDWIWRR